MCVCTFVTIGLQSLEHWWDLSVGAVGGAESLNPSGTGVVMTNRIEDIDQCLCGGTRDPEAKTSDTLITRP